MGSRHIVRGFFAKTSKHTSIGLLVGYGIICGLSLPLIVSSTFLREISLGYEAEGLFGALFLVAFILSILVTVVVRGLRGRVKQPVDIVVPLGTLFAGNIILLPINMGFVQQSWLFTIITACCIGFGLALAELSWLDKIARFHKQETTTVNKVIAGAFIAGALIAILILSLPSNVEAFVAVAGTVVSGVIYKSIPDPTEPEQASSSSEPAVFPKSVVYLALVSFIFGVVNQVIAKTTTYSLLLVATQALIGISVGALYMYLRDRKKQTAPAIADMYHGMFPVVALGLVALPFLAFSGFGVLSVFFVYAAFYVSSMRVRAIICQRGPTKEYPTWLYVGIALSTSSLCVLAGVFFSTSAVSQDDMQGSLIFVSLVSVFVLALNPVITSRIEKWSERRRNARDDDRGFVPAVGDQDIRSLGLFAEQHGLTPRESEVLSMISLGRTRNYIAQELHLSPHTIKGYIRNIYRKADASDKQDLLDKIERFKEGSA